MWRVHWIVSPSKSRMERMRWVKKWLSDWIFLDWLIDWLIDWSMIVRLIYDWLIDWLFDWLIEWWIFLFFFQIEARFRIKINRKKDTAPTAIYTSLRVNQGDRGKITLQELRGVDEDTEDARLVFDVVRPPRHGRLILHRDDGVETTTRSFTVEDIWRNRLIYEHDGGPSTTDSFDFVLTDGTHSHFFVEQNGTWSLFSIVLCTPGFISIIDFYIYQIFVPN